MRLLGRELFLIVCVYVFNKLKKLFFRIFGILDFISLPSLVDFYMTFWRYCNKVPHIVNAASICYSNLVVDFDLYSPASLF